MLHCFYYGSFVDLEDEPEQVWIEEIIETVFHEMQHHLESGGTRYLARQELEELGRILGQQKGW